MKFIIGGALIIFVFMYISGRRQSKWMMEFNRLSPSEQKLEEEKLLWELIVYFEGVGDDTTLGDLYSGRYNYRQMKVLKKRYLKD
ncbi:MAG: hypothetical protein IPP25_08375 [Saprospiraceae bacterium]|nr:hypothetical protein [Candidatus Opimibacter skivensis]